MSCFGGGSGAVMPPILSPRSSAMEAVTYWQAGIYSSTSPCCDRDPDRRLQSRRSVGNSGASIYPVREAIVRCVVCLMIVLCGLMVYAVQVDVELPGIAPQQAAVSPWRRTKDGWQRSDRWPGAVSLNQSMELLGGFAIGRASLPHPLIVALLLLLPSLLFLVAFSSAPAASALPLTSSAAASARTTRSIALIDRRGRW